MWRRLIVLSMVLSLAATFTACGPRRPKGFPKVYPCQVKVIQDSAPLEGAIVTFYPDDPKLAKWVINSMSDANGMVTLMTQTFPGAPLGKYKVTVEKAEIILGNVMSGEGPSSIDHVNPELKSKDTTNLEMEVVKGMKEPITLDVGPAP